MPKPTLCISVRDGRQGACDGPVEGLARAGHSFAQGRLHLFDLPRIRELKRDLQARIDARRAAGYSLPPDADSWSSSGECVRLTSPYPTGPLGEV
jgi:hypothetical protein